MAIILRLRQDVKNMRPFVNTLAAAGIYLQQLRGWKCRYLFSLDIEAVQESDWMDKNLFCDRRIHELPILSIQPSGINIKQLRYTE